MVKKTDVPLNEIDRRRLDDHTIQSVYQAGYSVITVNSIFSNKESFPDLLCRIIQRKLDTASNT
jgi:hypothetical protein